jgi:hypothetical protein
MKNKIVEKMKHFVKYGFERTTIDDSTKDMFTIYKSTDKIPNREIELSKLLNDKYGLTPDTIIKIKKPISCGVTAVPCYIPSVKYIVYTDSSICFINEDLSLLSILNVDNRIIKIKFYDSNLIAIETCEIPISYYEDIDNDVVEFPKISLSYKTVTNENANSFIGRGGPTRELQSTVNIFMNPFSYPISLESECQIKIPYNNADMQFYYYVKTLCDRNRFDSNYKDHYISIGDYVLMDSIKIYEIINFHEDSAILKPIISNGNGLVDVPSIEVSVLKLFNDTQIYRKDKVSMIFGEQILFNGNISSLKEFSELHTSIINIMKFTTNIIMIASTGDDADEFFHNLINDIYTLLTGDWKTICNNNSIDLLLFMNDVAPVNVRNMLKSSLQATSTCIIPAIKESFECMLKLDENAELPIQITEDLDKIMQCIDMLDRGEEIPSKL